MYKHSFGEGGRFYTRVSIRSKSYYAGSRRPAFSNRYEAVYRHQDASVVVLHRGRRAVPD